MIDNREFFVNDCKPKNGIVDSQTVLETETGFTIEVFKKKQVLADKRFAEKLQQREGGNSSSSTTAANTSSSSNAPRTSNINEEQRRELSEQIMGLFGSQGEAQANNPFHPRPATDDQERNSGDR